MARLLISVRSVDEACIAVEGGTDIVDIKEPANGPLGRADSGLWTKIRQTVSSTVPISVALGELAEWDYDATQFPIADSWNGISFAKLGLAATGPGWAEDWMRVQRRFEIDIPADCRWVAVVYADWLGADAPNPDRVLELAFQNPRCAGVLVDTWNKASPPLFNPDHEWRDRADRIRRTERFLAWAGGLGIPEIERLAECGLEPDIIAVRGAACRDGVRTNPIDLKRVERLRDLVSRFR